MQECPYTDNLFEDSLEVHSIDWVIVFAYFDETGFHANALDTVAAGYVFSKNGAKLFRQMFDENIFPLLPPNKNGVRIFHATKCIGGYEPFDKMAEADREHIVDLLVDAIKASATLGVVVGMKKEEYAKAIAVSPPLRELAGDEYSVCLIRCIENLAGWLNEENIKGRIEYVFEAGCQHQSEANAILFNISRSSELKQRYRWHNYRFTDKSPDVPQLFAADLLAWEWQRARINSEHPERGEWRLTLKKLAYDSPRPPHLASYQDATCVGIRAMVNAFYGVTSKEGPFEVTIYDRLDGEA